MIKESKIILLSETGLLFYGSNRELNYFYYSNYPGICQK